MARPVSTYSLVACDLERGPVGRRDAVEVPRRRLDRALGRAAGGCGRDAGVREPALRAGRARAAAAGASAPRRSSAADRGRRRARRAPARRRRRAGPRRHLHRARPATSGPAAGPGPGTPRRATSSSPARPSTRSRRRSRRRAGRSPSACSRRSPRRRRPAATSAAAVGGADRRRARRRLRRALRRPRRPARRRPRGADRGAAPPLRAAQQLFGKTPRDQWLPVDDELRAELDERLAGSATSGSRTGPAPRTSRSGSTATARSTRSCWPS